MKMKILNFNSSGAQHIFFFDCPMKMKKLNFNNSGAQRGGSIYKRGRKKKKNLKKIFF
jgi:hypothetical protein